MKGSSEDEEEFEDAVESLDSFANFTQDRRSNRILSPTTINGDQTPSTSKIDDNPHRRRLSAVRSRMRTEFGLGSSNFGGSQNSFDEISRSDCTSIASWGRNFLSETSNGTQPIAVCPTDTISTRAEVINFKQPTTPPEQPPPLLPLDRRNSRPLPPPLPKRPPPEKLTTQLSTPSNVLSSNPKSAPENLTENVIEKESTTTVQSNDFEDYGKKRGHAKTNSLDRGLTLAKTIKCGPFPPSSSKSSSLNRGMSPSIVQNAACEEEQRINNAHGVINQITLDVLSSSGEINDNTSTSKSSTSSTNKKKLKKQEAKRRQSSSSGEEEVPNYRIPTTLSFPSHATKHELPVAGDLTTIGEESSTASSTPIKTHPSPGKHPVNVPAEVHESPEPLETTPFAGEVKPKPNRSSHKRFASNVDYKSAASFKQQPTTSFKECRSATDLDRQMTGKSKTVEIASPTHKRMLSQTHSIDPITQDVERRMSTIRDHSTMGSSSKSDDVSRDQSLHSLHNSFDQARAMFKTYGNAAQGFIRGAYQKARNIVASSSTPKCSSLVGKDDEGLESDAASSTVSISTSENNLRSYSRMGDGYPVICRPKSSKRGPYNFNQLRVVQEINNEHSGAIWALKFSNCGRLLATAGSDNLVRVWVLKNYLNHFIRLREKYGQQHGNDSTMSHDFEQILQMEQKSKNFTDDESSISSRKSPLDSSASTKSASQNTATSSNRSNLTGAVFAPKPFCIFRGHTADVLDLAWSPKNYFLLSSGMDHTVKLWHLTRNECLCCFQHVDVVTCIAFMPNDDRNFISGSMDGKIRLWHIEEKKVTLWNEVDQHSNNNRFITAITFYKNKFIIVGTYDGRCFFYRTDLKYHTCINIRSTRGKNSRGHKISSLTVYKDYLLVTSNDSRIRMYNLHNITLICKFKGAQIERSQIKASFSPDGKFVICGSEDNFTYLWEVVDLTTALSLHHGDYERLRVHNTVVTGALFAPKPQLFFDILNEHQNQFLLPVYTSAYTKRKELSSPVSMPNSTSPAPNSSDVSERSHSRAGGLFSGLSSRVLGIANELRLSRRNLQTHVHTNDSRVVQLTGEIIVTADQNGSIKVLANPRGEYTSGKKPR